MDIKNQLYQLCCNYVNKRIDEINVIIDEAVEAANNETKSSAGDKYEVGREMMQQEIELNTARLKELTKQRETIDRINPDQKYSTIKLGALVKTNFGWYYMAISAGQLKIDAVAYYSISPASPAGELLMGKSVGDTFTLNGKQFIIEQVL